MTPLTRNAREGGGAGVFPEKHRAGKHPLEESVPPNVPCDLHPQGLFFLLKGSLILSHGRKKRAQREVDSMCYNGIVPL